MLQNLAIVADVTHVFHGYRGWQIRRADAGARAIGADAAVGFAWSGGDGAGAGRGQAATGSGDDNISDLFVCCFSIVGIAAPALSQAQYAINMSLVTCTQYLAMPQDQSRIFSAWMSGWFNRKNRYTYLNLAEAYTSSLSRFSGSQFSGWRSRSLSLGEGLTDSTGAPRDGTRADGVLGSRAAPAFFFLAVRLPGGAVRATGSIAAGTWRRRHSPGGQCRALSPDFPGSQFSGWFTPAVFIPWRGADGSGPALGMATRADGGLDRGRRRLFSF